jgi:hypothetical protein
VDANQLAVLQSGVFKECLQEIRATQHPAKILLPESFPMEQRGIHQLRIEEFEKIMTGLEAMGEDKKIHAVASTYGVPELPPTPTK